MKLFKASSKGRVRHQLTKAIVPLQIRNGDLRLQGKGYELSVVRALYKMPAFDNLGRYYRFQFPTNDVR